MPIRPLGSELQKKAERELNEVPDRIKEDLEHIAEWHQKERHLNIRTDEQWLIAFLRGCKFSLQQTKEKLDYFYTLKTLLPEYYTDRDPFSSEIQEILKVGAIFPLPQTNDPNGPRIILINYEFCDSNKISLINVMKTFLMVMDVLMLEDDNSTVAGVCVWLDYAGIPFNFMMQYTPSFLKKAALCIQQSYPLRIKGIYCTDVPPVLETLFNFAMVFLNDKIKSRFSMYGKGNFAKIYKDVPQSLLPEEYGGNGNSLGEIAAEWKKKIESYRNWFLEDAKYGSDEKLRLGKAISSADVFQMEGTFRKLTVD